MIQKKRIKQVSLENRIEIEDDNRNVKSKKTYNNLNTQRII